MFAQIDEALKMADHASQQSDRWAFFAALIVLGIFALFVLRYFVKQNEILVAGHAMARDKYHESLNKICEEAHSTAQAVAISLDKNTTVLDKCVRELSRLERTG